MPSWEPTERVVVPSVQQRWSSLTFVHFRYPPDRIAAVLPEGLKPDTFEGDAWVGMTPFELHSALVPIVPGPKVRVIEANVRTYVRDRRGRDGLWFLSLELDSAPVVAGLRTGLGVPYRWSRCTLERDGDTVRYTVDRRRPHRPGSLEMSVEVAEEVGQPDDLTTFLVGRWRAYSRRLRNILDIPVEHPPWPLRHARLTHWREEALLASVGLPPPDGDPHVLFSAGVDVRLGLPRLVVPR